MTRFSRLIFMAAFMGISWFQPIGPNPATAQICLPNDWCWQAPTPQGAALNGTFFVNSSIGWAVGDDGTIIKTSDGGSTWVKQQSHTREDLEGVFFRNLNLGWAVGNDGVTLNTQDGGETWVLQKDWGRHLKAVYFIDDNVGWAVGGEYCT